MTVNQHVDNLKTEFRQLSQNRQNQLRRKAEAYCRDCPHMADVNKFWKGLSARHTLQAYHGQ